MVRWVLDDGPFNALADAVERYGDCDLRRCPRNRLLVASATSHAAISSSSRQRLLELAHADGKPVVDVIEVLIGGEDPAGAVLQALHGEERTSTNLAEREAVAWASVHGDDAVLVTEDARAALTALAELGHRRVAHTFDLWLDLWEHGLLSVPSFQDLCERTKRRNQRLGRMPDRVTRHFGGA